MHVFGLSTGEQFSLLLCTVGILCYSSQTHETKQLITAGSVQSLLQADSQISSIISAQERNEQPATAQSKAARKRVTLEEQKPGQTPKVQKRSIPYQGTRNVALGAKPMQEIPHSWYYEWGFAMFGPLPFSQTTLENFAQKFAQELDESSLYFLLESPVSSKLGYFQLRSQLPLHLLWQNKEALDWPIEFQQSYRSASDQGKLLALAYRSGLYLHWAIPRSAERSSPSLKNTSNSRPQIAADIRIGSVKASSSSPWYTLYGYSLFPSSTDAVRSLASLAQNHRLYETSSLYDSDSGLGQNIGFSFDSRYLHLLALHQRSAAEEHFSYGAILSFDHSSKKSKTASTTLQKQAPQRQMRLQLATLFSQNLSSTDRSKSQTGDWYWRQRQMRQNPRLYYARPLSRWLQLLHFRSSLQQYYLQASWKQLLSSKQYHGRTRAAYLQLGSEQSLSQSPLDFWGHMQKYYAKIAIPFRAISPKNSGQNRSNRPKASPKWSFSNEVLATYYDTNWVDARRRIAKSMRVQRYRERLALQNKSIMYFRIYNKDISNNKNIAAAQTLKRNRSALQRSEHIFQFDTRYNTVQVLQAHPTAYLHFAIQYDLLRYRNFSPESRADSRWHWSFGLELTHQIPNSSQLSYRIPMLPSPLWQRQFSLRFGWKQRPPSRLTQAQTQEDSLASTKKPISQDQSRVPQSKVSNAKHLTTYFKNSKNRSLRFGWAVELQSREKDLSVEQLGGLWQNYAQSPEKLSNLELQTVFNVFLQQWKLGPHQIGKQIRPSSWWNFFHLRLQLGLIFQFPKISPSSVLRLGLRAKIRAEIQLAYNWRFSLSLGLDNWELNLNYRYLPLDIQQYQPLAQAFSVQLNLRYQFHRSRPNRTPRPSQSQSNQNQDQEESFEEQRSPEEIIEYLAQIYSSEQIEKAHSE